MNKTIITISIALLMLGMPASARISDGDDLKAEMAGGGVGTDNVECGLGDGTHTLTLDISTTTTLTSAVGASCEFIVSPGAGGTHTQVVLSGLQYDYDLYVKRGEAPTTTSYDCRPYRGGTTVETCEVLDDGSDVYVMVRRFSGTGTGAFTVTATMSSPPPVCSLGWETTPLNAGVPESASLSSVTGAACHFSYTPAGTADIVRFTMPPTAPANFNLYARAGSVPTTSAYDCRSTLTSSATETCDVFNSGATVYVMVLRSTGSGAFTLTADDIVLPTLENGVPMELTLAGTGATALVKLVVPEGGSIAQLLMAPADDVSATPTICHATGSGVVPCAPDADLYVRYAALPTTSAYDCRPYIYGNVESCTFSDEVHSVTGTDPGRTLLGADGAGASPGHAAPLGGAGKYFVMLRSFSGAPHVYLTGVTA